MKIKFLSSKIKLIIVYGLLISCAPKVQESDKKKPDVPELQTNDISLQQAYINPYASINFTLKKLGPKKLLSQTEIQNLFEISDKLNDANAHQKATDLLNQIENENLQNKKNITKDFKDTYYLQLVDEKTRSLLKNSVDDIEKKLLADTDQIESLIAVAANKSENKSNAENNLKTHIAIGKNLVSEISSSIQQANIFNELKQQVLDKLNSETTKYISAAEEFDTQAQNILQLTQKINLIEAYLEKLGLQLSAEATLALQNGKKLGLSIDQISTAQNSLQTLALTWKMLSPEERTQYFIPASQKLYDLLNKKNDQDIQCLIDANCSGFISKIILKIGVYPALDNYGILKIKTDLNSAALGYLNHKINALAFEKLNDLTNAMKTQIRSNVEKKIIDIENFKTNFKTHLAEGLKLHFKSTPLNIYVLSDDVAHLADNSTHQIQLQEQIPWAMNDLYSLNNININTTDLDVKQMGLIEKVLSLVDFSNDKNSLLENGISDFLKNPKELFLMPELQNSTQNSTQSSTNTFLVKDQAATLKLLTSMLTATADWKPSIFDHGISDISAQDLISDFKSSELNQSLFPKVGLFNICFSYAIQVLKQIQSEKSLVYLIDNKNQRVPISDYLSGKNHPTVALAGASDKKNNHILNTAKTSDLAALVEALSLFTMATKDIQNSKSDILKSVDFQNQMAGANKNIQLLVVTLANFISSQMVGPNNLVGDSYDFESQKLDQNYNLSNQVAAVSALVKAYETTGIEIYLLSAKEIYYSLNKNYFDPQLKFYKNNLSLNSETPTNHTLTNDVLNTLNQLIPLRKYLSLSSQVQFDRIFENWYIALLL